MRESKEGCEWKAEGRRKESCSTSNTRKQNMTRDTTLLVISVHIVELTVFVQDISKPRYKSARQ
jgi:hypothetical protein